MKDNPIKLFQLFEAYGEAYQPYISPVIQELKKRKVLDVSVVAFNKQTSVDFVIPTYKKRLIKEKWHALTHSTNLNFLEILSLEKKVSVIHIQQSYLFPKVLNLLKLSKAKRPKVILTLRGGDTYVKPWHSAKWFDFYANYGNTVDAFVVMSAHQKEYLHTKWHIDKERIHVIPLSFGPAFDAPVKQVETRVMRIVSAFRMCWEKNIEGNLRVVKLLNERGVPVQYDLYGDGSDQGQVYYLIDKYALKDCVTYHGRIENKALKTRLVQCDFYLQLSHSESLGMSVIEAQALGLPAIVSNSDGLPEVIVDGKTGFCVTPHDSATAASHLIHLWENPELYRQFSEESIHYSHQNFCIAKEVHALELLYTKIISP